MPTRLPKQAYVDGIRTGDRLLLSRAITLAESRRPDDQDLIQSVLQDIMPATGRAYRIGITGVPGVGKSSFIEVFGLYLTAMGKKIAVLAVDPSSERSGGSILGDKTRMEKLSVDPRAYIRPSPAGTSLGGVTRSTRQALLLCEAAGFEVILVETVGVGQAETAVRSMTDFFLLLLLAGAGDELQGIKRGIMEMADGLLITKADQPRNALIRQAQAAYQNALHLFPPAESGWVPPVLTCSAHQGTGIGEVWHTLEAYRQHVQQNGFWERNRQQQSLRWLHESILQHLSEAFYAHPAVQTRLATLEQRVREGALPAWEAARELLRAGGWPNE